METEDERLARELQAQFEAEALAADGGNRSSINRSIDENTEHSRTANWRSSGATARTDWSDDHMTDEQLAAMLESLQARETGRGSFLPSDRFSSQMSRRQSDGSSALARQLYEEEMQLVRQMEEDERMARQISMEYGGVGSAAMPPMRRHRATHPGAVSVKCPQATGPIFGANGNPLRESNSSNPSSSAQHGRENSSSPILHEDDSLRDIDRIGANLPCANDSISASLPSHEGEKSANSSDLKKPAFLSFFGGNRKEYNSAEPRNEENQGNAKPKSTLFGIGSLFPTRIPSEDSSAMSGVDVDGKRRLNFIPTCDVCNKVTTKYVSALGKRYHPHCFRCTACHEVIDASEPFAFIGEYEKQPLHRKCYAELYGLKCSVCAKSLTPDALGRISYIKHPFFDKECMCPEHALVSEARRCTGCHRFEPQSNKFADLGDGGRCVCWSCCRTVVVDSDDVLPIWSRVLSYMEHVLSLPIWEGMKEIPVLVVGQEALNEKSQNNPHYGSKQIITRGLCLTEHSIGRRFCIPKLRYNMRESKFTAADAEGRGLTYFRIPDPSKSNPNTNVTAILCLSGMPQDLTASILAHEATHAWFKMHPDYDATKPLPPLVEEGCCQLLAHLILTDGLDPPDATPGADGGPSDEKLRQYFKFSIETDENEIYGEGFRRAAALYAEIGIVPLLSHIVLYRNFPLI